MGWTSYLAWVLLAGLGLVLVVWGRPLGVFLSDVRRVREFIARFGLWAPLALIALEVAQVILAPIPGSVMELASGYLFGLGWGTLYSMIGLMTGTVVAMTLARRFGRPLVERLAPVHTLDRLDGYLRRRGLILLLLLYVAPFTPDDAICFLAGLTPLPLGQLLLVAAAGRLPGVLMANAVGASASALQPLHWLLIGLAFLAVLAVLWHGRDRLEESVLRLLVRLEQRFHR